MKTILHPADSRGHANHGWLDSYHSFSFANYYNPERMNFGALRVLNDDTVAGGMGFGAHPHANMEIVSIPLEGDLEHQDSTGRTSVIKKGDIQVMSAGTGITHSEKNADRVNSVKFLQIWIVPAKENVSPRYDQISLDPNDRQNRLQQILSPDPKDAGVWIHQKAWFYMGNFDKAITCVHQLNIPSHGVYAFVIRGSFEIAGQSLGSRDAIGIYDTTSFELRSLSADSEVLLIEVPLH